MSRSDGNPTWQPDWFTLERVDTVIVAFVDIYGRLLGKRMTHDFFVNDTVKSGIHACNYLLAADMDMNTQEGFKLVRWEKGYGDFHVRPDLKTLRLVPWHEKTAVVLGDLYHEDGPVVEEAPRRVLARQIERLAERGMKAYMSAEPEFYLFDDTYRGAVEKDFAGLVTAADYPVDYHVLQPGRDEDVLRRLRNEMTEAGIPVECSKGECGNGQHEVNLVYADAMEMADRYILFKTGAKEIAEQQGRSITFMAKWATESTGSSLHVHSSVWDAEGKRNLFRASKGTRESEVFRQFLGGLMKYTRELAYFFAPTVNAYKRYQPGSWAPTRIVWAHDNRTCGYRIVGEGDSLRIENRMPGADANVYLAFAATLAAGLRGIDERLDCGEAYDGDAYRDETSPRLPGSLAVAAELLAGSEFAREAFGDDVARFYVHSARLEVQAFRQAVTDWERRRYFEQI